MGATTSQMRLPVIEVALCMMLLSVAVASPATQLSPHQNGSSQATLWSSPFHRLRRRGRVGSYIKKAIKRQKLNFALSTKQNVGGSKGFRLSFPTSLFCRFYRGAVAFRL